VEEISRRSPQLPCIPIATCDRARFRSFVLRRGSAPSRTLGIAFSCSHSAPSARSSRIRGPCSKVRPASIPRRTSAGADPAFVPPGTNPAGTPIILCPVPANRRASTSPAATPGRPRSEVVPAHSWPTDAKDTNAYIFEARCCPRRRRFLRLRSIATFAARLPSVPAPPGPTATRRPASVDEFRNHRHPPGTSHIVPIH